MAQLKYKDPSTGDFKEIYIKVSDTLPIGSICQYVGNTIPSGYLMCNGQAISRVDYADLFAVIGTSFGTGDGVTTFNVPNFNGRVSVGLNSSDTDFNAIGKTGGSKYLQEHTHAFKINSSYGAPSLSDGGLTGGTAGFNNNIVGNVVGVTTGNSGNLQPYIVTNFIIKASKKVALDKGEVVDNLNGSSTTSAPSIRAVNAALIDTYSSNEVKTNKVWINNKPIYRKVITETITDDSGTLVGILHNISNLDTALDINVSYIDTNDVLHKAPNDVITGVGFAPTMVQYANDDSIIVGSTIRFILEYTKTTV